MLIDNSVSPQVMTKHRTTQRTDAIRGRYERDADVTSIIAAVLNEAVPVVIPTQYLGVPHNNKEPDCPRDGDIESL